MEKINFTEEQLKAAFEMAYETAADLLRGMNYLSCFERELVEDAVFRSVQYTLLAIGANDYVEIHRRCCDNLRDYRRIKGGERDE